MASEDKKPRGYYPGFLCEWRKCMGIEPTWDSPHCPTPDLKSGSPTSELGTSGRFITKMASSVELFRHRPNRRCRQLSVVRGIHGIEHGAWSMELETETLCVQRSAHCCNGQLTTDLGRPFALSFSLIYDCSWFFPTVKIDKTGSYRI